jgi:flagellar hook-basal body complex protein FliE
MVDPVKNGLISPQDLLKPSGPAGAPGAGSFGAALQESIEKANKLQNEADAAIQGLASGQANNIHDAMIAIEKANISFNLMLQVRNKLLAAYEEVMRTQV